MKLLLAIDENMGLNSKLSKHFRYCPYFGIYDTNIKNLEIYKTVKEVIENIDNLKELDFGCSH